MKRCASPRHGRVSEFPRQWLKGKFMCGPGAWMNPLASPVMNRSSPCLTRESENVFIASHFERDRAHFAISHANLRKILGSYLDRAPQRISLVVNSFGKPALRRMRPGLLLFQPEPLPDDGPARSLFGY